jgi:DNA sulfur modification protein DndC
VDKDKSLQGFIDSGFDYLEPLADFRDWPQAYSRNFDIRMSERRKGQEGVGPFKPECRQAILDRLLAVQREVGSTLISEAEVARIKSIWSEDECLKALNTANKLLTILSS